MGKDRTGGLQGRDYSGARHDDNEDYESIPLEKFFEYVTLFNSRNLAKSDQGIYCGISY
ncbi:hypothetical protein [Variovorax sp. GB1P17]|uniref:hypothetical protein n=1 Tax=Variovorax sp. GB1P17 TaxID=3443740 RepID=UPI003F45677B